MTELPINQIVTGDCREVMSEWPEDSIDFVQFSPPYLGLRDYGEGAESVWGGDEDCEHIWKKGKVKEIDMVSSNPDFERLWKEDTSIEEPSSSDFCQRCGAWRGQLGLEPDYRMYVQHLVEIGREVRRILKPSGSWWLNLGDTYAGSGQGHKISEQRETYKKYSQDLNYPSERPTTNTDIPAKCQMAMPERVMLALVDDGWIRRNAAVWYKPNPMPSPVKDRLNTTYEFVYHFVQRQKYYYDLDAIREEYAKSSLERGVFSGYDRGKYGGKWDEGTKLGNHSESLASYNKEHKPNPKGKNPGDVFEITTKPFPEAHFAVYPPELCELPIKSSCPPKVCVGCGGPYKKIVEREKIKRERKNPRTQPTKTRSSSPNDYAGAKVKSEGWRKTCDCDTDETKSGIVLDPMCGVGSTLIEAKRLGRNYIGIEISEKYAKIASERVKHGDKIYKRKKRRERKKKRKAEGTKNVGKWW